MSGQAEGEGRAPGFTFVRAADSGAGTYAPRRQRAVAAAELALHPAIERGLQLMRDTSDVPGATVRTLFSMPGLHIAYAWFKSSYPLPLHSHDVDCFYQVIAGGMHFGTERLGKGDGVFIPANVPYTVKPEEGGVEFLEIRTSGDYDTHYRAKTDAYWDRIAETRRAQQEIWASEAQPFGLLPL